MGASTRPYPERSHTSPLHSSDRHPRETHDGRASLARLVRSLPADAAVALQTDAQLRGYIKYRQSFNKTHIVRKHWSSSEQEREPKLSAVSHVVGRRKRR